MLETFWNLNKTIFWKGERQSTNCTSPGLREMVSSSENARGHKQRSPFCFSRPSCPLHTTGPSACSTEREGGAQKVLEWPRRERGLSDGLMEGKTDLVILFHIWAVPVIRNFLLNVEMKSAYAYLYALLLVLPSGVIKNESYPSSEWQPFKCVKIAKLQPCALQSILTMFPAILNFIYFIKYYLSLQQFFIWSVLWTLYSPGFWTC